MFENGHCGISYCSCGIEKIDPSGECNHDEYDYILMNGNVRTMCKRCFSLFGRFYPKKDFGELKEVSHIQARLESYLARFYEHFKSELVNHNEKKSGEWWRWYNSYLESDEWREKRKFVLERDGYQCQGCLKEDATQVHHLSYKNVGEELMYQLTSLCDFCHEKAHKK